VVMMTGTGMGIHMPRDRAGKDPVPFTDRYTVATTRGRIVTETIPEDGFQGRVRPNHHGERGDGGVDLLSRGARANRATWADSGFLGMDRGTKGRGARAGSPGGGGGWR